MFALSLKELYLSPHVMRFQNLWIYNLNHLHSSLQKKIKENPQARTGSSIWAALHHHYGIHLFSPLKKLDNFSRDYFASSQIENSQKPSLKEIQNTFSIFADLGLKKIEQLRYFTRESIQKRFGKAWGKLWEGIFHPEEAPWIWEPFKKIIPLFWNFEFESLCMNHEELIQEINSGLEKIAAENPTFTLHSLKLQFILSQPSDNSYETELSFTYFPKLQNESQWILKLLEEKISNLQFPFPIWKLQLQLNPSEDRKNIQLFLFNTSKTSEAYKNKDLHAIALKLKDQGFQVFEPAPTSSHLPEKSWKKILPSEKKEEFSFHSIHRPLFQYSPQAIQKPDTRMKFTERITWFDEKGGRLQRDYFFARYSKVWKWIFRDEKNQWFEQGIVE